MIKTHPTYRAVCLDCTATRPGHFRDEYERDAWVEGHQVQNKHRVTLLPTTDEREHPRYTPHE